MKYLFALLTMSLSLHASDIITVDYTLSLECPKSEEYNELKSLIPAPDYRSPNLDSWKSTTVEELRGIISLIESGNIKGGSVSFGTTCDQADIDTSKLQSLEIILDTRALPSQELESLKHLKRTLEQTIEQKKSYKKWASYNMEACHQVQMMMHKGKLSGNGTPVKYRLHLQCPPSPQFEALKSAVADQSQTESTKRLEMMHKLEMLILSGEITLASTTLEIEE